MKVFVVGAGTMGSGIAYTFAQNGWNVLLYDMVEGFAEKAVEGLKSRQERQIAKGKLTRELAQAYLANMAVAKELTEAAECDMVVEAIIENVEVKKTLFRELDEICPQKTILASNTSSLSITEFSAATQHPQRIVGTHFFNPAPVMKVVEVIKSLFTSHETFEKAWEYMLAIHKEPVAVKESPGFVVNRILIPMINEAICVLDEGTASVEDIDKAMCLGASHAMGPLATSDLVGNDVTLAIMETLYAEFGNSKYAPHPLLKRMVRAGLLGRKTGKGFYDYHK